MTTELLLVRYSDPGITSGMRHGHEEQSGYCGKAAGASGAVAAGGIQARELARMVHAPRQTVYRWQTVLKTQGVDALREMSKGGRPARLGAEELTASLSSGMRCPEGDLPHAIHPAHDRLRCS